MPSWHLGSPMLNFDDQDGKIWFNGELMPWRDCTLHVLSHGLHYASSVFEGERVYAGHVFRLREHSQRNRSSRRRGTPWPSRAIRTPMSARSRGAAVR